MQPRKNASAPNADPDEMLWRAAQTGNTDAFDALLQRHQEWIHRRVRMLIWSQQDADDITQEVLTRVIILLFRNSF